MNLPVLKSVTDIRKDAKRVFEDVRRKNEVVLVTKNTEQLSVIMSPDHFGSIMEENETLWEELEMSKSKKRTVKEKSFSLKDIISGKV